MRSELIGKPLEGFGEVCRRAAGEGAVLLKNDNQILPIKKGEKVAVFGRCQIDFYRSGTGSGGSVNVEYTTNLLDSLKESGIAEVDAELEQIYREWLLDHPFEDGGGMWAAEPWNQEEMPVSDAVASAAADRADKALIVLGRTAGEDKDYSSEEGSYLLTETEQEVICTVTKYFKKVCIVMNVSNIIDMNWVDRDYVNPIEGVIFVWQGGIEGGNAAADVLTGKVNPSGKLTDTIARHISDFPSDKNNGDPDENVYQEDVYVGYRYFETFAPEKVQYPFGYGLSYTTFATTEAQACCDGNTITVSAKVTNTGSSFSGKEVVQVYYGAPQGKLGRPVKTLAGFAKTSLLAPGASEIVTVSFPVQEMAAYDDLGVTGVKSAYVLEAGTYVIYVGNDVRSAAPVLVDGKKGLEIEKLIVTLQCSECAAPEMSFTRMRPGQEKADGTFELVYEEVPVRTTSLEERILANLPKEITPTGNQGIKLMDVKDGKASMEQFVAQLSDEELCILMRGEGMCSPKATPGIASVFGGVSDSLINVYGIPVAGAADGPSGIRMDVGAKATQVPIGTLLACSFNTPLVEELYEMEGQELLRNEIDTLLGPGINVHRHPLNGRNFEYFSEDPLVTGKMAAAMSRGINKYGPQPTVKHMACNSQETRRHEVNAVVSERALREIYLKGFELAVKEGKAKSIMTSYNPINGHWSASNYDMNTMIVRGEWGYDGIIMTDWWAGMNDPMHGGPSSVHDAASMVKSQNDLYMVVFNYGAETNMMQDNLKERLEEGWLTRGELQRSAMNICRFVMNAPVMSRGDGNFNAVEKVAARKEAVSGEGSYHEAGIYTMYVTLHMNAGPRAQAATNVYLNDYLLAPAQTNGTEGEKVRKMLCKVELEDGCYELSYQDIKAGVIVDEIEFVKE